MFDLANSHLLATECIIGGGHDIIPYEKLTETSLNKTVQKLGGLSVLNVLQAHPFRRPRCPLRATNGCHFYWNVWRSLRGFGQ